GIHLGLVLINLVTVGLILFLGRNLLGQVAGVMAAAAYSVLSLMPYVLGSAAHATHFVVVFAVAGVLLLARALHRQSKALIFGKFWFWTINYASQYGRQVPIWEGLQIFVDHFGTAIGTAWPIWAAAAVGFVVCIVSPSLRVRADFLLTFAFFSVLAVCAGFYFRPHYFILLLPAVSLLAGAAVVWAINGARIRAHNLWSFVLILFAVCLAWPLWSEADFFFERPLAEANRMVN